MQWVCGVCGYVHDDEEAPDNCPVCGAPRSKFSEWYEDDEKSGDDDLKEEVEDVDDPYYGEYDEQ
ncbi:MAG TPA: hypothetical protein VN285_07290 [Candidatus Deferrimicrobium sp.]|nr:hypothetical protein [Candidatus Deferrimicrobium sp.]